uniref:Putative secreted protein n=1 Tax=Anopheles darlingi TaxID=43151 RepID=A0A2M4DCH4_ANODA
MEMLLTLSLCFCVCCPLDDGGDWLVLVAQQSSAIISDDGGRGDGENWFQLHIQRRRRLPSSTGNSGVVDDGTTHRGVHHTAYPVDITVDSFHGT